MLHENLRVTTQHNVRTATGHVGGHGHVAGQAGLGDDAALFLVVLRVQHVVLDALAGEQLREVLRTLDGGGAHQDRLALFHMLRNIFGHGGELGFLGLVNQVVVVLADVGLVRRDRHNAKLVNLVELSCLGFSGTGHAGELVVEAEIVLQGDGGQGLVLVLDLHALFGLDGLVHALVVATARQDAAGEGVNDEDFALADDVVLVALEEFLRLDGVVQVTHQLGVFGGIEVVNTQLILNEFHAFLGYTNGALALVHFVVDTLTHARGKLGEDGVELTGGVGGAGDDEGGPGFVNKNGVNLIHDGVVVSTLHHLIDGLGHVVAQVVKAQLVVGAVGDVSVIGPLTFRRAHVGEDHADSEAEEAVNTAHHLRVTLRQVIVHGDNVDTLATQAVEVGRQNGGCLLYTSDAADDIALV